jgi:hypothetical protein
MSINVFDSLGRYRCSGPVESLVLNSVEHARRDNKGAISVDFISRICRLATVLLMRKALLAVLAAGLFSFSSSAWGQTNSTGTFVTSKASSKAVSSKTASSGTPLNPCDLALPYGTIDQADVTAAINMVLSPATCTANIDGANVCNVAIVQRVVNASLSGGTCLMGNSHAVTVNWVVSTSSNVAGYNIYRGATSSPPYTKLNPTPVVGTTFTDSTVQAQQTYYYVATAVDTSGNESAYSSPPAQAVVPYP